MQNIPKLYNLPIEQINETIILEIIKLVSNKRKFVITPLNILKVSGFPTLNQTELLKNKSKKRKNKTNID